MGRGLSDRQRRILLLARSSRRDRARRLSSDGLSSFEREVYTQGVGSVDLWRPEIVRELYGWEVRRGWSWKPKDEDRWHYDNRPYRGCVFFDPASVGRVEYKRAQASLSRSLTNLEARGLIERGTRGDWTPATVWLTEAGAVMADRLAAEVE